MPLGPSELAPNPLPQPRLPERLDAAIAHVVVLERHFLGDPFQRDVRLPAAQFGERGAREVVMAGHGGGCGQHAVGTDKVRALP